MKTVKSNTRLGIYLVDEHSVASILEILKFLPQHPKMHCTPNTSKTLSCTTQKYAREDLKGRDSSWT